MGIGNGHEYQDIDYAKYIHDLLARSGMTEPDYENPGKHTVRQEDIHLVSEYKCRLKERAGNAFEFGYTVSHIELKPEVFHCTGRVTHYERDVPFGETEISSSFQGDKTYFINLIDIATEMTLIGVEIWKGIVENVKTDFETDNEFILALGGVKKGDKAIDFIDALMESYFNVREVSE
jgi:hypothetical protein